MAETYSAGIVTAYGAAVRGGYTGTYEQWCQDMAQLGDNVSEVREKAAQVEQTAQSFTQTIIPAAIQSVENEGIAQVGAVEASGAAQVQAVEAAGTTQTGNVNTAGAAQVQAVTDEGVLKVGAVEAAGAAQVQAVENAGAAKVQDVNTAGQTALTAVSGAQTAAVSAVQTESTTQQAAIQQKGEDTIESIPSDYTELTEEVSDLKSASSKSNNAIIAIEQSGLLPFIDLIPNSYINSSGALTSYNGWSATDFIEVPENGKLLIYSGGESSGRYNAFYDSGKTFIPNSTFNFVSGVNDIAIPQSAKYFRLSAPTSVADSLKYQWWIPETVKQLTSDIDSIESVVYVNKSLVDADEERHGYFYSDMQFYNSSSWTSYLFENNGYKSVTATLAAQGPNNYGIAFFNSKTTLSEETFISGELLINGVKTFVDIDVPTGTELILISNRSAGYENPSALLKQIVTMTQIDDRITEIEKTINIPDYIINESTIVSNSVMSSQDANVLTFVCISDMHYHLGNTESINAITHALIAIKDIRGKCYVDTCINLGDMTYANHAGDYETGMAELKEATNKLNDAFFASDNYRLVGNHDVVSNGVGQEHISMAELYSLFGIYQKQLNTPTQNRNAGYGYQDFQNEKIRIICLNTSDFSDAESGVGSSDTYYGISSTQLQWLAETMDLSDKSDTDEWGILIICHVPLDNSALINCTPLLYAYEQGSAFTYSWRGATVSYDYTNKNDAHFIGMIHGHVHDFTLDNIRAKGPSNTIVTLTAKRMAIPNACPNANGDSLSPDANGIIWGTEPRFPKTPNSANDTTFDVVTINMNTKIINAHNYGAGKDRTWDFSATYSQ